MLIASNFNRTLFTVFTPTYNRADKLHRVYESLQSQSLRDFEWLIIDDGSIDNTEELVENWIKEAKFTIRYFWQRNNHKKAAFNRAVQLARGEFFLVADSDDTIYPNALEMLFSHWCSIPDDQKDRFSGVCGLDDYTDGSIVGSRFPGGWGLDSSLPEVRHRYRVKGDKRGFVRTSILNRHPFPDYINGFVPESVIWSVIGSKYKTRYINEFIITYYNDSENQITKCVDINKSLAGFLFWKKVVLTYEINWFFSNPIHFVFEAARWTRFFLHLKKTDRSQTNFLPENLKGVALVFVSAPLGFGMWIIDRFRK
jgi:glycosyltransferase involved in cell wall biosynthesis